MSSLPCIHALTETELGELLASWGEKPFRAKQILKWVYEKRASSWETMTDLSKGLRDTLQGAIALSCLREKETQVSQDGQTIKFLFELSDGKLVESVLIYAPDRRTVCVSSQVGCPARCAFCASGKEGLIRNLSAAEIFEQVLAIDRILYAKGERVSHVVFMGMGEPFENYDAVLQAIRLINDADHLGISQRRITVSTVGVVEGIQRFTEEGLSVNLVLSLHAPNQHIRKKIIPYARKYPIEEVLEAMVAYTRQTRRDITYEYTLLKGINDAPEHAEELARLLRGQACTVNLIPYNPVSGLHLQRPDKEAIDLFSEILNAAGVVATQRYTKGKDIAAACGQLALKHL
jgi:23S rRNA (adenine2503-C2)-methyltransferase